MAKFIDILKAECNATGSKPRDILTRILNQDYEKAPTAFWNEFDIKLTWSPEEKIYIGFDDICFCQQPIRSHKDGKCKDGKKCKADHQEEWSAAYQFTNVAHYSLKCKNPIRKGKLEVPCNAVKFISILDEDKIVNCRKCGCELKVKLNIHPDSEAYEVYKLLYPFYI